MKRRAAAKPKAPSRGLEVDSGEGGLVDGCTGAAQRERDAPTEEGGGTAASTPVSLPFFRRRGKKDETESEGEPGRGVSGTKPEPSERTRNVGGQGGGGSQAKGKSCQETKRDSERSKSQDEWDMDKVERVMKMVKRMSPRKKRREGGGRGGAPGELESPDTLCDELCRFSLCISGEAPSCLCGRV